MATTTVRILTIGLGVIGLMAVAVVSAEPPIEVADNADNAVGAYVRPTDDIQGAVIVNGSGYSFALHAVDAQLYANAVFPLAGIDRVSFPGYRAIGYLSSDCSGQAYLLAPYAGFVVRTSVYNSAYQIVFTPLGETPQVRTIVSVRGEDQLFDCGRLGTAENHASVSAYPNSAFVTGYPLVGYSAPLHLRIADAVFADGFGG